MIQSPCFLCLYLDDGNALTAGAGEKILIGLFIGDECIDFSKVSDAQEGFMADLGMVDDDDFLAGGLE